MTLLDDWRTRALDPPRAHGAAPATARLRVLNDDFQVDEELRFSADGGSGHVLLRVEKRGLTTLAAAGALARAAGCPARDVGFAGMKDRHAVTSQWFTVPAARRPAADWAKVELEPALRLREALPHSRKLRRGALAGNRFRLVLRDVVGDRDAIDTRLQLIAREGTPNYFGPQRFGREGSNLAELVAWQTGAATPGRREARGFLLSAARALVFNAVLGERVREGSWNHLLPGEIVSLDGSRSVFLAAEIDATLAERCERGDVHPSGPLPGRGTEDSDGLALERQVRAGFEALEARLGAADVEAARRALRLLPRELRWQWQDDTLMLEFGLGPGAYATALLREVLEGTGDLPEGDADA